MGILVMHTSDMNSVRIRSWSSLDNANLLSCIAIHQVMRMQWSFNVRSSVVTDRRENLAFCWPPPEREAPRSSWMWQARRANITMSAEENRNFPVRCTDRLSHVQQTWVLSHPCDSSGRLLVRLNGPMKTGQRRCLGQAVPVCISANYGYVQLFVPPPLLAKLSNMTFTIWILRKRGWYYGILTV
jgi:hypothetical protein